MPRRILFGAFERVKKVFLPRSQTRPTALGSRLKRLRLAAAHSLCTVGAQLARLRAEFAIDRQENMRFCRAEMPSFENTQSILCGLFLVCEHFCSGRTASHRTALGFRGIFVLLDAGGLSPAKDKRAKSTEKAGCPTCVPLLIDAIILRTRGAGGPAENQCLTPAPLARKI